MTEKKYPSSSSSSYRGRSDRDGSSFNGGGGGYNSYRNGSGGGRSNGYGGGTSGGGYNGGGYRNNYGGGGGGFGRSRPAPPPPPAEMPVYKAFYKESSKTANRNRHELSKWTADNQVTFRGHNLLNPILEFDELGGLPEDILYSINKQGFTQPTVIQASAWPYALSGRDLVGIAQTGSGKTLGYTLPGLVHVDGNHHRASYGPSVLILAPTRELAQQIKEVVATFRSARCVCVFGGASKGGQRRELDRVQPSIIIACPGRLIDFVEDGAISLQNITYLVLDEADRMLDMGFEPQIRKIVDRIPKTRQTLMWSATWPREVRKLAEDFLVDYAQVNIGSVNLAANHNITQIIDVCMEIEKFDKLYKLLQEVQANNKENKTIIFAETKRKVDELAVQIRSAGWYAGAIHGDKPQQERDWVLNEFRQGKTTILIATDVAARGLDVDDIKYVVNFDYPSSSEDYVHRIGRTGRRDKKGTAYTFFTMNNAKQANELIGVLREANQAVSPKLSDLASQSHRYGKATRSRYGAPGGGYRGGGGGRFGGSGGGYGGGSSGSSFGGKRKFDENGGGNGYNSGPAKRFNSGTSGASNGGASYDRFGSYA